MSRRASQAGIEAVRQAMKRNGWTQKEVAKECGFSRSTLNQILGGQAVRLENLEELCHLLDLEVGQILEPENLTDGTNLDSLVQSIRDRIRPLIQEKCGTMRVLDMSQPIELGNIYTHVNILEKISGRTRRELAEMMPNVSPEMAERFGLGAVREERIPGLDAVEKYSKLMILGKPGAGKTTFLKHLAIACSGGKFQSERIPLFITLKEFAEADGQPNLLTFIDQWVNAASPVGAICRSPLPNSMVMQQILDNGHALILLDGLDEVRETDVKRVLRQIQQFSEQYSRNAFVITCRIAAREYTFECFTEVEVADFDDEQIADVSRKWFLCKQDEVKAERFLQELEKHPPIKELASSPLLLTLLCLVFEDAGDFPANRAELYQNGVDVLLKKWDVKRNIERDQIYKKLSLKRKEDLLSQIAWRTFETGNYFFKQSEIEQYIREFIEHLPGAITDEETLNPDSEAVLKSIEAQHGLFVERAYHIYSFSHLTFHEYFAAREAKEKSYFMLLTQHLTKKRWREVILLTVEMLPNADDLLQLIACEIEKLFNLTTQDEKLRRFLSWVRSKPIFPSKISGDFVSSRELYFWAELNIADFIFIFGYFPEIKQNPEFAIDFKLYEALFNALLISEAEHDDINLCFISNLKDIFDEIINCNKEYDKVLPINEIKSYLNKKFPKRRKIDDFWNVDSKELISKLRELMVQYRNIGHYWQCNEAQKEKLQQYYDANKLLVDCLNSDCYVSRAVRQDIEDNLLLPIAEIEKRQREKSESSS